MFSSKIGNNFDEDVKQIIKEDFLLYSLFKERDSAKLLVSAAGLRKNVRIGRNSHLKF